MNVTLMHICVDRRSSPKTWVTLVRNVMAVMEFIYISLRKRAIKAPKQNLNIKPRPITTLCDSIRGMFRINGQYPA